MLAKQEVKLHRAYLLHSRAYRDSSMLVDLLSEEFGHVSAIVYVGKSKKSNKKGMLQPFSCLQIELKGQSDLKTLSRVEHAQKSLDLSGHFLYSGFYLNELLVRLLPENIPCPSLYHLYQTTLSKLSSKQPIEPLLRCFEMTLLEELGMSLDFSVVAEDNEQQVEIDTEYQHDDIIQIAEPQHSLWQFIPEQGFLRAEYGVNLPCYEQSHLQQIGLGKLHQSDVLLTCKRLMRQVLQRYLGNKPLHSRKLFTNRLAK